MKRGLQRIFILVGLAMIPQAAWSHGPHAPDPSARWWTLWNVDPWIIINLVALSALYAGGYARMRAQRAERPTIMRRQAGLFWAGVAFLILALLSPIDVLASELLWVHMVQHMVLMNLAAPLVVMGAPMRIMIWSLPPEYRQLAGRWRQALGEQGVPRYLLWQPIVLWCLYALVLWTWHLPSLYEAALRSEIVHDLQHLMFFAVSCLFWRVLFDPIGRLRLSRGAAVVYLFLTSLHATVLGVFMALAPSLWYPTYAGRTEPWGLKALEDQQFAGYIMWMPACMVYAVIAAVLFVRWIGEADPRSATTALAPQPRPNPSSR